MSTVNCRKITFRVVYANDAISKLDDRRAATRMKEDMKDLKYPYPSLASFVRISPNSGEFSWIYDPITRKNVQVYSDITKNPNYGSAPFLLAKYQILQAFVIDLPISDSDSALPPRSPDDVRLPDYSARSRHSHSPPPYSSPESSFRKRSRSPASATTSRPSKTLKTSTSSVKPSKEEISRLTRELWDIRRETAANLARQAGLVKKLKELGVDEPDAKYENVEADDMLTRIRIQIMEKRLHVEEQKRKAAETDLEDIRRECRKPFVVPALLDAFIAISNLTSAVASVPPLVGESSSNWIDCSA